MMVGALRAINRAASSSRTPPSRPRASTHSRELARELGHQKPNLSFNSVARPSRSGNTTDFVMPRSTRSSIMDWREAGSTMQRRRIDWGTNVWSPSLRFPWIVKHDRWLRSRGWTYAGWMANGRSTPRLSFSQAPPRFSNAGFSAPRDHAKRGGTRGPGLMRGDTKADSTQADLASK
jgi:hypothetical protein